MKKNLNSYSLCFKHYAWMHVFEKLSSKWKGDSLEFFEVIFRISKLIKTRKKRKDSNLKSGVFVFQKLHVNECLWNAFLKMNGKRRFSGMFWSHFSIQNETLWLFPMKTLWNLKRKTKDLKFNSESLCFKSAFVGN